MPGKDRARLLVIEDEPSLAKVLQMRLEIEGFDVEIAFDGAEGMKLMGANAPDLVVCDLMMPVMDGLEVTRAMKGNPKLKSIPILILTALKSEKQMKELEKAPAPRTPRSMACPRRGPGPGTSSAGRLRAGS